MTLGFIAMLPDDFENLSQSVIATNFFGNNILAAITTKNYWDVVNEYKPLMHTWYVGLVMQFYLVYPILFYVAKWVKIDPQRTLLILISSLAVLSLVTYFAISDDAQRFYYLPSRFFEFAAGGLLALTWKPKDGKIIICKPVAFICYLLLIILMVLNVAIMPAIIRLVVVVLLSVVLIMSPEALENRTTGNKWLAKIGAASYSIFVWHQVLLAFCRYSISSEFTIVSYTLFLITVAALSYITYIFVEQKTSEWLRNKKSKVIFYTTMMIVFIGLNLMAGYIYMRAGVVRDVPELYISKNDIHRGLHSEYNDKIYKIDKPFETSKRHWLVIGNSFGRDFANVILESPIADSVEVSYLFIKDVQKAEKELRFKDADKVFISTFSSIEVDEQQLKKIEQICTKFGLSNNLVFVGTKNFGVSNGKFYINRYKDDYFEQRTKMEKGFEEFNERLKTRFGDRYLDIIGLVKDEKGCMPVFTPDHHFISQDCRHFSKGGAIYFAQLIDWNNYLE